MASPFAKKFTSLFQSDKDSAEGGDAPDGVEDKDGKYFVMRI